jgi:hypothetical protein
MPAPPYGPSVAGRSDVCLVPNESHLTETAPGRLLIAFSITNRREEPRSEPHKFQRLPAHETVRGACSRPLGRAHGNRRTARHYRHRHRRSSVRAARRRLERFGRRRLTKCTTRIMLNIAGRGRRYVRPRGPRCGSPPATKVRTSSSSSSTTARSRASFGASAEHPLRRSAAARPGVNRSSTRGQRPVRGQCDGHGTMRLPEDAAINIKNRPSPFRRGQQPDGNAEGKGGRRSRRTTS